MKLDYLIKDGTVVTEGMTFQGDLGIGEGVIRVIGEDLEAASAGRTFDAQGCYVAPGFVDPHTHMSLPVSGTVSSDDFFTGGRAGAWGGVTTIIDFTTPEPDQNLSEAIESRREQARVCPIDFSFHGTMYGFRSIEPEELCRAVDLGVTSFKFFTAYGESNRRTPDGELLEAFIEVERLGGRCMVHCENDEIVGHRRARLEKEGRSSIEFHPLSRPPVAESTAVSKVMHLAARTGGNVHLAHLTTEESVDILRRGKRTDLRVTGETCPQYLLLTRKVYEEENGYLYSATPPLREDEDREALWAGLREGIIDLVSTDHCPFRIEQKEGYRDDFLNLPQGLPGVETLPSLLFTEGVKRGRLSPERMVKLISENPARSFGLYPKKGSLTVGTDADIVVLDPTKEKEINPDHLHMNSDFNPYTGKTTRGWPRFVFLRGEPVLEDDRFVGEEGNGQWLRRSPDQ